MHSNGSDPDELLDRIYDIAVAPERFEQLVDSWARRLKISRDGVDFALFHEPGLAGHVERAERVLHHLIDVTGVEPDPAREWAEAARAAAVVADRGGQIIAANDAARRSLGVGAGHHLEALPLVAADRAMLAGLVRTLGDIPENQPRLMRLQMEADQSPILVRLMSGIGANPDHFGLVTSILHWSSNLSAQLQTAFNLTEAELAVLRDLTLGYSVKEIAERSERAAPTIRSHLQSILEKTDTHSQLEVVRMTLAFLNAGELGATLTQLKGPPGVVPEPNDYQSMIMPDGRRLDYLVIGDANGRSFLFLPTDIGFTRFPDAAEQWLAHSAMRMIVPVRAGYGYSSPLPKRRGAYEVAIEDMQALLDALGVGRCPIAAMCDDFRLAVEMAAIAPERVSAIIGIAPTPPASAPHHYQRMSKWTRFIAANARFAPRTFPYFATAAFQFARRIGPKRFMQTILAGSPPDQRLLDDKEVFSAILRGSEIAIGPNFAAHAAYAAGVIASHGTDWSKILGECPVPMVLFAGHQDPLSPYETVKEFADIIPAITLYDFPEYGLLLYPIWPRIFEEIRRRLVD